MHTPTIIKPPKSDIWAFTKPPESIIWVFTSQHSQSYCQTINHKTTKDSVIWTFTNYMPKSVMLIHRIAKIRHVLIQKTANNGHMGIHKTTKKDRVGYHTTTSAFTKF